MKTVSLKVNANLDGISNPYLSLVKGSVTVLQNVLESQEFLDHFLAEMSKSNNLEGELSEWKDKSAKAIYYQYLNLDSTGTLGSIDLTLKTYNNPFTSAVGYGNPGEKEIYLNIKFFKKFIANFIGFGNVASVEAHEHGHKRGFGHQFSASTVRENSLPYVINRAFDLAFFQLYDIKQEPIVYKKRWYVRLWSFVTRRN